jgi:hypothetical protein
VAPRFNVTLTRVRRGDFLSSKKLTSAERPLGFVAVNFTRTRPGAFLTTSREALVLRIGGMNGRRRTGGLSRCLNRIKPRGARAEPPGPQKPRNTS